MTDELSREQRTIVRDEVLDAYIERHFGRPWCLQQNGMFNNNTVTAFEVYPNPSATPIVNAWLASPIPEIPGRLNQFGVAEDVEIYTDHILNELCNGGLLDEGDLTVIVSW